MADRIRKEDLKEDEFANFVANTVRFLKEHRTGVLLVAALLVVAVVVSIVVVNARAESRRQRQAQLAEAMFALQAMNYPQAARLYRALDDLIAPEPKRLEAIGRAYEHWAATTDEAIQGLRIDYETELDPNAKRQLAFSGSTVSSSPHPENRMAVKKKTSKNMTFRIFIS